ncbi:hypothetical protein [Paenibacillus piri]|uniref:Uncharacterized protein n=1 Tax=Paenibacillus piri TaxID=2547395 RepID=A0A4R5KGL2_9BACL|nr:hypothetical protein [Paenibacillus piri]TDF93838.1 hypothetical protein E1757_25995 [Paenibacillus piri]
MPGKERLYKLSVLAYLILWFTGCFWLMAAISSGLFEHALGIDLVLLKDYIYYGAAGAIGGTLYAMRLFHQFYDSLTERWVLWYLLRPINCAGAAVMTIILFESGVMLLQTGNSVLAKIGIAFLVGFGYGKVMDKLKSVTETLFNGKSDSDSSDADRQSKP